MTDRAQDEFREFVEHQVETPGGGRHIGMLEAINAYGMVAHRWLTNTGRGELADRVAFAFNNLGTFLGNAAKFPIPNNKNTQGILDDGIAAFALVRDTYREMGNDTGDMRPSERVDEITLGIESRLAAMAHEHFPKDRPR